MLLFRGSSSAEVGEQSHTYCLIHAYTPRNILISYHLPRLVGLKGLHPLKLSSHSQIEAIISFLECPVQVVTEGWMGKEGRSLENYHKHIGRLLDLGLNESLTLSPFLFSPE